MKSFSQYDFDKIIAILASEQRSEVEEAIHDSISVLYYGFASSNLVWRYIGLVTALERLLTMPHEGSIKRNLAERLAWILGETETPEWRKKVSKKMEEIYGRRSEFIHQTTKIETVAEDTWQLHWLILGLVSKLSKGQFKTVASLKQWVADKILGF